MIIFVIDNLVIIFIIVSMITTYEQFEKLRQEKGVSCYRICKDLEFNPHFFTWWKNGRVSTPRVENLIKITEYLTKEL
ncbi:MAG: hypothetical protein Unbinned5081contig1002_18 [Prokaryotic dsDNA virus sp.]|nr:MAG: hypothetical protein Unbinned5081contig1002_18 [Prokaryotic dsDNA virus sp.]